MEKVHFQKKNEFEDVLKSRVNDYFTSNHIQTTGNWQLHAKAILTIVGIIGLYYWLVFQCDNVLEACILTFFLVQCKVLLAFNVMHDGGHYSFSKKKWVNDLAVKSLDFLGSSSFLWRQKHNSLHHTYTNIHGKDDDIEIGDMIKLSPTQEHKSWHKYQHIYALFLYGFLSLYLLLYSDFQRFISGKVGDTPIANYTKKELTFFISSKVFYFLYTLIIPMFFHSPLVVLAFFIAGHLLFGLTLSVVFQLAHTVEETKFPIADSKGDLPFSWVEHQLHTTSNFAPNNHLLTFYCGGLNYQVEHHLFHRISHVHYPKISHIVKQTCEEFGKPYHSTPSFIQALKSHLQFLKRMGNPIERKI